MAIEYYICEHCGNIVTKVTDKKVPVFCCGQKMTAIEPGKTDGAVEKHLPVVSVEGNLVTVKVGSVPHPMLDNHYIEWISLETESGNQIKYLKPGDEPEAVFALSGDKAKAAYAYCNLHGLWKTEII